VGEQAPPLDLLDLVGRRVALADLRGRPVLVSFLRHAG
jgi:peroxiredoxin